MMNVVCFGLSSSRDCTASYMCLFVDCFLSSDSSPKCETVFSVNIQSAIFRRMRLSETFVTHSVLSQSLVIHSVTDPGSECV